MHHDWLFNFRALQLRLYSTETIMQLAEFIINVIKLYEMPARLKTSRNIISRRKKGTVRKIVNLTSLRSSGLCEKIFYIFHALRRRRHHTFFARVGFRLCAKKKRARQKDVFQFRFRSKNRKDCFETAPVSVCAMEKKPVQFRKTHFRSIQLRP